MRGNSPDVDERTRTRLAVAALLRPPEGRDSGAAPTEVGQEDRHRRARALAWVLLCLARAVEARWWR
ncbi:MAG: hypothetical protein JW751_14810 [Polyangiaceae bacterium]|nr:hypothetical protein [Polyangiaceae bacterium]